MIYKPNHSDWVRENQSNELPDPSSPTKNGSSSNLVVNPLFIFKLIIVLFACFNKKKQTSAE